MIGRLARILAGGVAMAPMGMGMGLGPAARRKVAAGSVGGLPANALTLNGESLILNGETLTLGA